jgi:hypothetical protein
VIDGTGDPAARHRSAPAGGYDGTGPNRIMALVDERDCSLVTVSYAAPLAAGRGVPLLVVLLRRRFTSSAAILATTMLPTPGEILAASHVDLLEDVRFAQVAAALAPSGLPWDFAILDRAQHPDVLVAPADRRRTQLIGVRHRHRWRRLLGTTPRRAGRSEGPPPLMIACAAAR